METIALSTSARNQVIDLTDKIEKIVADSGVKEGICLVYAPHATAAIMVLELDGAVENDVLRSLSSLVPNSGEYEHSHGPKGHGSSHVKSALLGSSRSVPVSGSKLQLGTWQSIAFCELDGPRDGRKVFVQVVGK
jgi:secondary thiamine-phosphate synthase enzyme